MRFRVLGPLRVRVGSAWLPVRAAQKRVVLAVLLVEAGRAVTTDRLVDEVWGDRPPPTASAAIQGYVFRLRQMIGGGREGVLITRTGGYELAVTDDDLDVLAFARDVAVGQRHLVEGRVDAAEKCLSGALELWRGAALADVPAGPTVSMAVARWERSRLGALEERLAVLLELGRYPDVIGEARELVDSHPLRERGWEHLMLALYRGGRRAEALEAYQHARRVLVAELGLDPGARLRELHDAILADDPTRAEPADAAIPEQVTVAPAPATTTTAPVVPVTPAHVPADLSGFTGREAQLARLDALVPEPGSGSPAPPVCAIAGTAGVGKTTLALHWAHRVRDRFPDGQLYVNLRGFDPGGAVMAPAEAIRGFLDALQVPAQSRAAGPEAQAALYRGLLAGRRMLVVLDNARDAEQVRPLLPGSPSCFTLVTSRNQLTGLVVTENAHLLTLDVPSVAEAREMLVRRIAPHRVAAEPRAVDEIIHRCARLPLALAIVAARSVAHPGFPLAALAAELSDSTGRLDALAAGEEATDVRAVFSWSYRTLGAPAGRLFRLLGLHPGPDVPAAAAASLAGLPRAAVRPLLAELVRAHLLIEHSPGRYALHGLLRAYAAERAELDDGDDARAAALTRILDHYLHTGHTAACLINPYADLITLAPAEPGVTPEELADDTAALAWFGAERPVLLAALARAADAGLDRHTWQLAWAMGEFFDRLGHWHDMASTHRAALAAAARLGDPLGQAVAHRRLGRAAMQAGGFDKAFSHYRRALDRYDRAGSKAGQARTHLNLCWAWGRRGNYREGLTHARRCLDLYRAAGDRSGQASALNGIGWCHAKLGDHAEGLAACEEAIALLQEVGDRGALAATWDSLGYAHDQLGNYPQAVACYERALALSRQLAYRFWEADVLNHLGDSHRSAGHGDAARRSWLAALDILTELHHADADSVRAKLGQLNHVGHRLPAVP